jgi:hypothetical protein
VVGEYLARDAYKDQKPWTAIDDRIRAGKRPLTRARRLTGIFGMLGSRGDVANLFWPILAIFYEFKSRFEKYW